MKISSLTWALVSQPIRAARGGPQRVDSVELSRPVVAWSAQEKKLLKQRFNKLDTRSLRDEDSRKQALGQLMRQEALGKTSAEAGDWIEALADSASSRGLLDFYYARFWEDLEVCGLEDGARRDAYLGMTENLFGDQQERLCRWQLIDQSKCGQPWPERAEAMGAILSQTSLKGLSRIDDACRSFQSWETVVQAGLNPAQARRVIVPVADRVVSENWWEGEQRESAFQSIEQDLIRLIPLPSEAMEGVVRAVEQRVSPELFSRVAGQEPARLTPAARLLPSLVGLEVEDAHAWLDTFEALIQTGLDPIVASFALQQHLTLDPVRQGPGPDDPAAEAARLRANLSDALQMPEPVATSLVDVGPDTVTVGSVRLPVRRPGAAS